jgi:hypothetical protein
VSLLWLVSLVFVNIPVFFRSFFVFICIFFCFWRAVPDPASGTRGNASREARGHFMPALSEAPASFSLPQAPSPHQSKQFIQNSFNYSKAGLLQALPSAAPSLPPSVPASPTTSAQLSEARVPTLHQCRFDDCEKLFTHKRSLHAHVEKAHGDPVSTAASHPTAVSSPSAAAGPSSQLFLARPSIQHTVEKPVGDAKRRQKRSAVDACASLAAAVRTVVAVVSITVF